ncbi:hypothetical protein JMJ58_00125 [Haloterrigena salifodinae]|uniref:Uncharacterized protein n=1 Tax=Haloterrigena salifodinae TaxID=2675099 RepID=A0A8T8E6W6_9EURY|nr:hypothetical protein JMJ58_00125 [Haloterrigena salifodinae]
MPPTGERFEISDMARFVVEDAKLREERTFFDPSIGRNSSTSSGPSRSDGDLLFSFVARFSL